MRQEGKRFELPDLPMSHRTQNGDLHVLMSLLKNLLGFSPNDSNSVEELAFSAKGPYGKRRIHKCNVKFCAKPTWKPLPENGCILDAEHAADFEKSMMVCRHCKSEGASAPKGGRVAAKAVLSLAA